MQNDINILKGLKTPVKSKLNRNIVHGDKIIVSLGLISNVHNVFLQQVSVGFYLNFVVLICYHFQAGNDYNSVTM